MAIKVDHTNNLPYVPANHHTKWTAEDMLDLCDMYINNKDWAIIALQLSRTESACKNRLYILKTAYTLMEKLQVKSKPALLTLMEA